jgi:hypothetical protein
MDGMLMKKLKIDLEKLSKACQIDFDGLKKNHQNYLKKMIYKKLVDMAWEIKNSEEPISK